MSIWAKLVFAVLVFVAGAAFGLKWEKGQEALRRQAAHQEVERMRVKAAHNVDVAATGHEQDREKIRTEFVTITQEVEHVIEVEKTFYRDACFDADGLRQLQRATGAADAASGPARPVP